MSTSAGAPVADTTARYLPFGDWRTEPTAELTDRGYTSHKHNNMGSDDIGLIYMNARYYVPGIARFASADTIVPNPSNPQSYNRYSYVRNNPLNFVDPTGHVECGLLGEGDAAGCEESQANQDDGSSEPPPAPNLDKCQSLPESCEASPTDSESSGTSSGVYWIGLPVEDAYITLGGGFDELSHPAVDLGPDGELLAIATGTVVIIDYVVGEEGHVIIIEYKYEDLPAWLVLSLDMKPGESLYVQYQHMEAPPTANVGDIVVRGQVVGNVGDTGRSFGIHVHIVTRIGDSGILGFTEYGLPYSRLEPSPNGDNNRTIWSSMRIVDPTDVWRTLGKE